MYCTICQGLCAIGGMSASEQKKSVGLNKLSLQVLKNAEIQGTNNKNQKSSNALCNVC